MKSGLWLSMVLLTGLLSACGGSGGGDDVAGGSSTDAVVMTSVNSGVAVDPYISNAQFEEISADGKRVIQHDSFPSGATGHFSFTNAIEDGSIIRIKISAKGLHANAPYTGVIKRRVMIGDEQPVVVSPLTTLLANGMSPAAVIQMMNSAGLRGLTESDLYTDPMAALVNKTGNLTNADLVLLQANMAVNAFMEANEDFNYGGVSPAAAPPASFADIAALVQESLNPTLFQQMTSSIGADFTVGDLADTAVIVTGTVVSEIQQEVAAGSQTVSATTINQFMNNAMADAPMIAGEFYSARTGGGTTDPGTGNGGGTTPPLDGQTIFTANCSGCHTVGTGTGIMDLAGDGAKVTTKFGNGARHNGRTLTADEIAAVAAYYNSQGGTTDPGTGTGGSTPPTGNELYVSECQGCHGSLATSSVKTRTPAGIQDAINADLGGMGSLILTSSEIQSIADTLAAASPSPPTQPPQDRTGQQVYDQECAICHVLGTHDTSGNFDLAGLGAAIIPKVQGGHNNKNLTVTSGELTALADYADTFTPAAGGGNGGPVTGACDSCHGQPPNGSSFPNAAGAHATHTALNGVGTSCDNCHTGAAHNSWVDLGFAAKWNAESGPATDNLDGTCSSIICHGGQKTPVWGSGSINVNTQCQSCHASGTAQYNSYASGRHQKHVSSERIACTVCHDTAKLAVGHFSNLSTQAFEQAPSATLNNSLNFTGSSCNPSCHGSERW